MAVMNSLFKCEHLWNLCHKNIREIFPIGSLHQPTLTAPGIQERIGQEVILLCLSATWWKSTGSWEKYKTCLPPPGVCQGSSGQAGKQPIARVPVLVIQSPVDSAVAAVTSGVWPAARVSQNTSVRGRTIQLCSKLLLDRD